ncbi:beta strand repeat-containing protein, partial [Crenothrix sp.]|uniref:beta strand repeat-containing protein n=1 Tax=Crenothrix sp. TaxID=3100433 RepID=UPI00374D5DE0
MFARTVLALFFLLASPAAWAAITFDNAPSGGTGAAAANTMELIRDTATTAPTGQYIGLRFSSSTPLTNVYAKATVGGVGYSLDLTEAASHLIGDLSTTAKTSYWYINKPQTTANGTFQVEIFVGDPAAGGVSQGISITYTLGSNDADQPASANKISSVVVNGGNPIQLGQAFNVVICYDVGSINNILVQPAGLASFDPNNLRLGNTLVTLYGSTGCTGTTSIFSNQLYFTGALTASSVGAVYTFTAIGTFSLSLSPYVSAQIGQYKFNTTTAPTTGSNIVPAATNKLSISKAVNITSSPGGTTVTYALTATNSGSATVSLDDFVDTLPTSPAAATYVTGSSTIKIGGAAAVALANPLIRAPGVSTLTWTNPSTGSTAFNVPAGGSIVLTFQAAIPNTAGAYENQVIGHIGTNIIGSTNTVGSAAATATTTIGADHGDAPTSFGDAANGVNATVFLGNVAPDADTAFTTWQGQTTANGDDTTSTADEGIAQLLSSGSASLPVLSTATTTYNLTLRCQGTVTANAVNGWIDFNRNGVFDTGEGAQGTCSGTAVGSTVTLTWAKTPTAGQGTIPTTFTAGASYARFRIASIASTSPTATGADGETEDYPLTIVPPPATVTVNKISNGGVGTFPFTGSNGLPTTATNITTVTAGTSATVAALTSVPLTTLNTATTITEGTLPAGYALTSATCTGLNGTDVVTVDTATRVLTIPATSVIAGAVINCTFTNTNQPVVTVNKISIGGVGVFPFTGTNGLPTTATNITTVTAGTSATVAALTSVPLTILNTATTITEGTLPVGYALTSATCTGLNGTDVVTVDTATRVLTIPATSVIAGAVINCTFTNTKQPVVTVNKISIGGVGTFPFTGSNGLPTSVTNITTVTAGTSATIAALTSVPLTTLNTATTITEGTLPAGFVFTSATCTGLSGTDTVTVDTATRVLTIPATSVIANAVINCTFTNTKPSLPTVTLTKISNGGVGAFTFTGTNGWTSQTITTVIAGTGVAGAKQTLTAIGTSTDI